MIKSVGGVDAFEGMFPGILAVDRIFLESLATAIFVIKTLLVSNCNVYLAKMYYVKDCSVELKSCSSH